MRFHTRSRTPQLFPSANASKKTKRARGRACEREQEREEKNGKITNCTVVSVSIDERARAVHSLTLARKAPPQKRGEVSHDYKKKKNCARAERGVEWKDTYGCRAHRLFEFVELLWGTNALLLASLCVVKLFCFPLFFLRARMALLFQVWSAQSCVCISCSGYEKKKKIPSAG